MIKFRFEDPGNVKEKLAQMPVRLRAAIVKALEDSAVQIQREAKINAPVFRGALRASIVFIVNDDGKRIKAEIGSGLIYAGPTEEGAWLFAPPTDNLRAWAARRLGDETLAFVVARSISRRGLKAHPYLRPALETTQPRIAGYLEARIKQALQI